MCPGGNNPDQYRIWEAIMAGSIPVVEDPSMEMKSVPKGVFIHPRYGNMHNCRPSDTHALLKETNAPVFFVKDWRDEFVTCSS